MPGKGRFSKKSDKVARKIAKGYKGKVGKKQARSIAYATINKMKSQGKGPAAKKSGKKGGKQ